MRFPLSEEITVADLVWAWSDFETWGYPAMLKNTGATLIDINRPDPYADYATVSAGADWFIYETFRFNRMRLPPKVLVKTICDPASL